MNYIRNKRLRGRDSITAKYEPVCAAGMTMKIVLHADMNSYFASVEQQANPFLRGKSVAICSRVTRNACVIACSIEAKKRGVQTGMGLQEARDLAHDLIALQVDPCKVKSTTERIFTIFADYTPSIEAYSIDEAFLDLTGYVKDFEEARALAVTLKRRIRTEVGEWLRCSIGISHTRWLAKYAGEFQKPDGLTVLRREDLPRVYADAPVDDAWGIAAGWRLRLAVLGIRTLGDLLHYNPLELLRIYGKPGYALWSNIAGVDEEQVKRSDDDAPPKSIGHSYVFYKRTGDERELAGILMKLCERVGRRLRRKRMEARAVHVAWRYTTRGGDGIGAKRQEPLFESYDLFKAAWGLFTGSWDRGVVSWFGVTAYGLSPAINQLSFLGDKGRRQDLAGALDAVNDRWGEFTVIRGRMWDTAKSAPERIGFRQTVGVAWRGDDVSSGGE